MLKTPFILAVAVWAGIAHAGSITFSYHAAAGNGTAQVFDGGPVRTASGHTFGPSDPSMSFGAIDFTRSGSYGGSASASGSSYVNELGETMEVTVDLTVAYLPSLFPGGDRPGGTAEGELHSVIEFEMPADELIWAYVINSRVDTGFSGSTSLLVENVSRGEALLSLSGATPDTWTSLVGEQNDLIRITTMMSGSGSAPATATFVREYFSRLGMIFEIPEPSTALLIAVGAVVLLGPRRSAPRRTPPGLWGV